LNRTLRNQLINLFWTMLGFAPVLVYWCRAESLLFLYVCIAVSLAGALVPGRFYQLSPRPQLYRRLGVTAIRAVVQDGDLAKQAPATGRPSKARIANRAQAGRYLHTLRMYENFHWICFLFFLLSSGHAFIQRQYLLAVLITLGNLIYNICPMLLQQYNRARIRAVLAARRPPEPIN
jgi:hypothetical protein